MSGHETKDLIKYFEDDHGDWAHQLLFHVRLENQFAYTDVP
jgi:hypothetical protein